MIETMTIGQVSIALTVICSRCKALPEHYCVVEASDYGIVGEPSPIHTIRLEMAFLKNGIIATDVR